MVDLQREEHNGKSSGHWDVLPKEIIGHSFILSLSVSQLMG
jgi:hypothetical protein